MKLLACVIALVCVLAIQAGDLASDRLTSGYPGWPSGYQDTFQVSAGFLNTNSGKSYYVWLDKESSTKVEDEPIVLFINGGQGCSSLQGLIQEIGPYRLEYPKEVFPSSTAGANEFAWNKDANLLFIEAPVQTGFSQYTSEEDYTPGDLQTATELYTSLKNFFSLNPTYNKSKFFIAGEGLSGQYIPTLVQKIFAGNEGKSLGEDGYINLQSIMLGNAMLDDSTDALFWEHYYSLEWFDDHGLYGPFMDSEWYHCINEKKTDPGCEFFLEKNEYIKTQINPYDATADCQNQVSDSQQEFADDISENSYCLDFQAIEKHYNDATNRSKLNIGDFPEVKLWQVCHIATKMNYVNIEGGSFHILQDLIENNPDFKVVLYSGLNDSTVPYQVTEEYYKQIKRHLKKDELLNLEPFLDSQGKQLAGWTTAIDQLQFVRVRGAGHQVPTDQASASLKMLRDVIAGNLIE